MVWTWANSACLSMFLFWAPIFIPRILYVDLNDSADYIVNAKRAIFCFISHLMCANLYNVHDISNDTRMKLDQQASVTYCCY